MEEKHELIIKAIDTNTAALVRMESKLDTFRAELDTTKKDVIKLRYYLYAIITIVLFTIGRPELLTGLLGGI